MISRLNANQLGLHCFNLDHGLDSVIDTPQYHSTHHHHRKDFYIQNFICYHTKCFELPSTVASDDNAPATAEEPSQLTKADTKNKTHFQIVIGCMQTSDLDYAKKNRVPKFWIFRAVSSTWNNCTHLTGTKYDRTQRTRGNQRLHNWPTDLESSSQAKNAAHFFPINPSAIILQFIHDTQLRAAADGANHHPCQKLMPSMSLN